MYRSKKYISWIKRQYSVCPHWILPTSQTCDIVPAHQRLPNSCGTGLKPPDTFALPLTSAEHQIEHSGDKTFWKQIDRAKLCVTHVVRYLDETHNIDGWRLALDLLTKHIEDENL